MASQNPNDLYFSSLPEYKYDSLTSTYYFDGDTVPGNPTVGVFLTINQNLYTLDVFGSSDFAGFGIGAPIRSLAPCC